MTHPKEKFSPLVAGSDPEGILCVGVDVGGLDLEDVCWYSAVRVNAHVLVNDGLWNATTCRCG